MSSTRERQTELFRELHRGGDILVLPNAWDVASARLFELAGARAIGTTSAGVAWSLGYPDGQRLEHALLVETVGRIIAAVSVPVTVDLEAGYGATPSEVCDTVEAVVGVGAVGINLEDRMEDPRILVEKIAALRQRGATSRVFVNARTDAYLRPIATGAARFEDTVRRLDAYAGAGADSLFVPGLADLDEIARLVRAVRRPLNVYAGPGVPPVRELARAGVARVSVGCGPMQATLALTRRIAEELFREGTYTAFTSEALAWTEANQLFTKGTT